MQSALFKINVWSCWHILNWRGSLQSWMTKFGGSQQWWRFVSWWLLLKIVQILAQISRKTTCDFLVMIKANILVWGQLGHGSSRIPMELLIKGKSSNLCLKTWNAYLIVYSGALLILLMQWYGWCYRASRLRFPSINIVHIILLIHVVGLVWIIYFISVLFWRTLWRMNSLLVKKHFLSII